MAASSLRPMRRMRISSAPALMSKLQPPALFTSGIGSVQSSADSQMRALGTVGDDLAALRRGIEEGGAVVLVDVIRRNEAPVVRAEQVAQCGAVIGGERHR